MKIAAYLLMLAGICLFVHTGYVWQGGVVKSSRQTPNYFSTVIEKNTQPELFRKAMAWRWEIAIVAFLAGLAFRAIAGWGDRSNLTASSDALDDLNRELTEEEERRKRPFHKQ